jgi:ssDNA-binding Zn-finger/Zn-ribbon topoisomerase 1
MSDVSAFSYPHIKYYKPCPKCTHTMKLVMADRSYPESYLYRCMAPHCQYEEWSEEIYPKIEWKDEPDGLS